MNQKPLIAALLGQKPTRTPIWFMRQAGRYLPEYRELRAQHEFLDLCQNAKLASEVTLQPLRRFDLDAAIIFADILLIAESLGQKLSFGKGHGPILDPAWNIKLLSEKKVSTIAKDLGYVGDSLRLVKKELKSHQALIGFAGAPLTVAFYMVEGGGGSDSNFFKSKNFIFSHSKDFKELLSALSEATFSYLKMQVEAGAEALMLFDTWAGELPALIYEEVYFPILKTLTEKVSGLKVPLIYFSGQGGDRLKYAVELSINCLSIDWRCDLSEAIQLISQKNKKISVQGNLDPLLLTEEQDFLTAQVEKIYRSGKKAVGHVFNVGHGVTPQTKIELVEKVISTVRALEKS